MPHFTTFLSFLGLIVLGAEARIPSQNLSAGDFHSYDGFNSNAAVYEAWKGPGEFSLLFNSRKPNAFLAYQDDSSYNHFDLFLVNGKILARVCFDECLWKKLTVEGNFSDSQWHSVRLTRHLNNVSLTVDGCYSQSIPCRYASSETERWQALYVGSIPWNISIRDSLAKPEIFYEAIMLAFQGCIGHVTQTAPGEKSRPLALRSSEWTGSDCKSYCAPGWKCNPINDVTRKECECPGYGNEKSTCKLHSSKSNDDLATIIMATSSTLSQSLPVTSNKYTTKLSSAIQKNVEATSSSKITDKATPTGIHSASEHVQDSSRVKAQFQARIPSQNLTTGVFLSFNERNTNAVYEAWKGPGEFSLLFNSRKPNAFLAYQDDSSYNHFYLLLVNGKIRARVWFDECQSGKKLTVEGNFSDSQWHSVRLTRQLNNVSLTVDGCYSQSIPCRYASSETERWQALYVGSIPWNISIRDSLVKPEIFYMAIMYAFQGCIGHVTQTAPGEKSRPLALRSSKWTGSDCKSYCAPGWKCNPIDDVTRKECECPGYGNEKSTCKLHSSKSNDDLATIIIATSSTLSQSLPVTSNKYTTKLSSAIQKNVEATSSSKITDKATPTSTHSASEHVQDSSRVKAQYIYVAYLDQLSSVPGKSSHPQLLGLVSAFSASTSLFTPDRVFPSSVEVQPNSSVDNNGSEMASKGNTSRILCSFVLVCLCPAVSLLGGFMTQ